jgi:hypothetical protein
MDVDSSLLRNPCEASDGTSLQSSRAIAYSDDHSRPHLDPALPGVQKVAAKNLAFGFLDLRLRMAMSIRIDQG